MSDNLEKVDENIDQDKEKHPLAIIIDDFVHSILDIRECETRLSHVAKNQLIEEAEKITQELQSGINLLESTDNKNEQILAIKIIESNMRKAKRFRNSDLINTFNRSLFINLFSAFDKLSGNLLSVLYERKPVLFNSVNRDISLSEVLSLNSINELKNSILLDEIDSFRRKSYAEQFGDLESKFSINLRKFDSWPLFVECSQRRNLLTHCDGIVSSQYIKICKENGYKNLKDIAIGDKLEIDDVYFHSACVLTLEVGVMLCQTLWRKVLPKELSDADNHLHRLIYSFLGRDDWFIAIKLSQFANNLPKYSNEITRRIILINYSIALCAINKRPSAIKLLEKEDWSATTLDFRLATSIIKEDYDEAKSIMLLIGQQGELLDELGYHEWPLFRDFRNTDQFLEAYNEIYEYPYVEKLNEMAEKSIKNNIELNASDT